MKPEFTLVLHAWQSFYALTGSASATLTGLIFIAASLGSRLLDEKAGPKIQTFITPTVLYFSLVLMLSALMNAPTQSRLSVTVQLAAAGLFGAAYSVSHLGRMHRITHEERITFQVWLWNVLLPLLASLCLLWSAFSLHRSDLRGLNTMAAGVLLFVAIGLHNAWEVTLRLIRLTPS